jgi:hypothetical protein
MTWDIELEFGTVFAFWMNSQCGVGGGLELYLLASSARQTPVKTSALILGDGKCLQNRAQ